MEVAGFVEWTSSLSDEEKAAFARRVAAARAKADHRFLREARAAAEVAISDPDFEARRRSAVANAVPEDWLDDGRDLEAWNRDTGNDLRAAYEDALTGLGAGNAIGKEYRRALAGPLLDEVPGLAEALGLA
jgi:hypothetical protein